LRQVAYTAFPDLAGRFDEREKSLPHFVHEVGIVLHRQIPPFEVMNALLMRGSSPRVAEWEPFEISLAEYEEVVADLMSNPAARFNRLEPDVPVHTPEQWWAWLQSVGLA